MIYLSRQDIDILAAFEDEREHSSYDIAEQLRLPSFAVRSTVQALRRNHLVTRSWGAAQVGRHHITEAGKRELAERRQLRLVEGA